MKKARLFVPLQNAGYFDNKGSHDYGAEIDTRQFSTLKEEARKEAEAIAVAQALPVAEQRQRQQHVAVYAFLKQELPEMFLGFRSYIDAAGNRGWAEIDFYQETVAKWL